MLWNIPVILHHKYTTRRRRGGEETPLTNTSPSSLLLLSSSVAQRHPPQRYDPQLWKFPLKKKRHSEVFMLPLLLQKNAADKIPKYLKPQWKNAPWQSGVQLYNDKQMFHPQDQGITNFREMQETSEKMVTNLNKPEHAPSNNRRQTEETFLWRKMFLTSLTNKVLSASPEKSRKLIWRSKIEIYSHFFTLFKKWCNLFMNFYVAFTRQHFTQNCKNCSEKSALVVGDATVGAVSMTTAAWI